MFSLASFKLLKDEPKVSLVFIVTPYHVIVPSAVESHQMLPYKAIKDECGNFGMTRHEVRWGHNEAAVRLQGSSASCDSYPVACKESPMFTMAAQLFFVSCYMHCFFDKIRTFLLRPTKQQWRHANQNTRGRQSYTCTFATTLNRSFNINGT